MTLSRKNLLQEKVIGQAVGATGFEPALDFSSSDCVDCSCADCDVCRAANALQTGRLNWLEVALNDADLEKVIHTWNKLPQSFRQAILSIAETQM
jgi:hypothetical protein